MMEQLVSQVVFFQNRTEVCKEPGKCCIVPSRIFLVWNTIAQLRICCCEQYAIVFSRSVKNCRGLPASTHVQQNKCSGAFERKEMERFLLARNIGKALQWGWASILLSLCARAAWLRLPSSEILNGDAGILSATEWSFKLPSQLVKDCFYSCYQDGLLGTVNCQRAWLSCFALHRAFHIDAVAIVVGWCEQTSEGLVLLPRSAHISHL